MKYWFVTLEGEDSVKCFIAIGSNQLEVLQTMSSNFELGDICEYKPPSHNAGYFRRENNHSDKLDDMFGKRISYTIQTMVYPTDNTPIVTINTIWKG